MCLTDRLRASIKGISEDEVIKLDMLAQTAVFTSQGVPFMLSGEELFRTKRGVHNSFNSPDRINQLNWDNLTRYKQVFEYYRNLISLRKHHPAFTLGDADKVREHLEFLPTADNVVAYRLKNHAGGDKWNNIIVVLNANTKEITQQVPAGNYTIVCCYQQINENGMGNINGTKVNVPAQTALIIHD